MSNNKAMQLGLQSSFFNYLSTTKYTYIFLKPICQENPKTEISPNWNNKIVISTVWWIQQVLSSLTCLYCTFWSPFDLFYLKPNKTLRRPMLNFQCTLVFITSSPKRLFISNQKPHINWLLESLRYVKWVGELSNLSHRGCRSAASAVLNQFK